MTAQDQQHLFETIDSFSTAMLSTVSPEGVIHARPMTVAGRDENTLWFATHLETDTVDEVRTMEMANASFQSNLVYISVAGPAAIVRDRNQIHNMWKESWSAWFPAGPTDPDLVLIQLEGRSADIWDLRGAQGVRTAMKALTNLVSRQLDKAGGAQTQQHITL